MDPDSLNSNPDTNPDPAFQVNLDPDLIQIQGFDDQNLRKKNTAEYFFYLFDQKLQFTYVQAIGEEKSSALKREHPALQKMKFIDFFLCLLVIFALLDPDCES